MKKEISAPDISNTSGKEVSGLSWNLYDLVHERGLLSGPKLTKLYNATPEERIRMALEVINKSEKGVFSKKERRGLQEEISRRAKVDTSAEQPNQVEIVFSQESSPYYQPRSQEILPQQSTENSQNTGSVERSPAIESLLSNNSERSVEQVRPTEYREIIVRRNIFQRNLPGVVLLGSAAACKLSWEAMVAAKIGNPVTTPAADSVMYFFLGLTAIYAGGKIVKWIWRT